MWDQLVADKQANIDCPRTVKFGAVYYRNLKSRFRAMDDPSSRLPTGHVPTPACLAALTLCFEHNANRQPMRDFLQTCDQMTKGDFIAAAQLLLNLNPCTSREQLTTQIEVAKAFLRLDLASQHPEILGVCIPMLDRVLMQVRSITPMP